MRYKKIVQTLTTIPNFISWVLVYSFAFTLFSVDAGLVNRLLMDWGVIDKGINFLLESDHIWLKMTAWSIWKGLGWGSIMYLAAIAGIDQELYEAARVDGAGRWRQMWNITLPGLLPTYFVLLLLSIANLINNGMDQYFVFKNAMNKDTIEVLDLYVYNLGFGAGSTSGIPFATAISMLKSIISLSLLFVANSLSRFLRGESIF
jgi:putative aldouronate transport system permease protein